MRASRPFLGIWALVVAATAIGLLLTGDASSSPSEPFHIVVMPHVDGDEPHTIDVDAATVTGQIRSLQGLNAGPRPQFPWMADLSWTVAEVNRRALAWERVYNTVRPHQALGYKTPQQFLEEFALARTP